MEKWLVAAAIFAASLSPASAQVWAGVEVVTTCGTISPYPALSAGVQPSWMTVNPNGALCTNGVVTQAPYAYTPLTAGQHNLAIVSSTALTVPTGATYATVQAATAQVKYTTDGTTTPTASVGQTLAVGSTVALSGATTLANFRAISASGTLDVEYFK